jgi:lipopolysaccharide export system permease protein
VTELEVEKYQRLLNPLAYVILTIIGVALSSEKKRGGMGLNLAFGITLAFSLIMFMKMTQVFATNADLPAIVAVALPLFIYGIIATVLVIKAPK